MRVRFAPERSREQGKRGDSVTRRHKPDYLLIVLAILLLAVGFVTVYAISPGIVAEKGLSDQFLVSRQIVAIVLGLITFVVVSFIPFNWWRSWVKLLAIVAVVLTIAALLTPLNAQYPAHRWVRFGGMSFQTAEFVKLAIVVAAAAFFADRAARAELSSSHKTVRPVLVLMVIILFVIAGLQSDLGSAAVMIAVLVVGAYLCGMPLKRFLPLGGAVLALAAIIISLSFVVPSLQYRVERLTTFLQPANDCQDAGYQTCQALIAVGSGGMTGRGLGKSVQASYLPEAANDSIFAIIAEKFGFIGVAIILGIYVALFTRMKRIMDKAPSLYARLLVAGVLAWFSTQAIINIGAMLGLLPLKGITLPFVSYGGTSLLFTTAALGLVFQISRYTSYRNYLDSLPEAKVDEQSLRHVRGVIMRRSA